MMSVTEVCGGFVGVAVVCSGKCERLKPRKFMPGSVSKHWKKGVGEM